MKDKVLVFIPYTTRDDVNYRLLEMSGLLESLGLDAEYVGFKINLVRPGTFFNEERIDELKDMLERFKEKETNITALILDVNLSGAQVSKLKEIFNMDVIDKTVLILKIFESRATTKEAKLQVEIATLQYQAAQLVHKDADYDQVSSGSGKNKGSGEKEKELEKRRIKAKIYRKKKELEEIKNARKTGRILRKSNGIPTIAIVGYTNAGKSTLINLLLKHSHSKQSKEVYAENRLFATLETSTRLIDFYNYPSFLLTDTVGFLKDLPHFLISAFRSTLEEIKEADLLIEVVDVSSPFFKSNMETTETILKDLGADSIQKIVFLNKYDLCKNGVSYLAKKNEIFTSLTDEDSNCHEIIEFIMKWLTKTWKQNKFFIPYEENINEFKKCAYVIKEEIKENGILYTAKISPIYFDYYSKFILKN